MSDNQDNIDNKIKYFQAYIKALIIHQLTEEYHHEIKYFKHIIAVLTIEKRFPEVFKAADRSILKALAPEPLPVVTESISMIEGIENLYKTIYDNKHKLRNNLFFASSIPIVSAFITLADIGGMKVMTARSTLSDIQRNTDVYRMLKPAKK